MIVGLTNQLFLSHSDSPEDKTECNGELFIQWKSSQLQEFYTGEQLQYQVKAIIFTDEGYWGITPKYSVLNVVSFSGTLTYDVH